jgi:hypothetical protein
MFKILGFLVGSLISIAALVMLIGMPDFHLSGDTDDGDRYDVAIRKLKEKQHAVQQVVDALPIEDAVQEIGPVAEKFVESDSADLDDSGNDLSGNDFPGNDYPGNEQTVNVVPEPVETVAAASAEPDAGTAGPEWQAFWNPFRSQIAARGFVRRLESVTGLDYRVVKVRNGVYQVAFSYSDDAERTTRLSQIAAATGLDLSDSTP